MRPRLPAMLLAPGGLGLRFALCRYRRFFGLRSSSAVSSVASGRIEFVSQPLVGLQFYGLSVHFQLLSTPCRHDAVTFSFWREAPPQRDSHPPVHAHSQAHRSVPAEPPGHTRSNPPLNEWQWPALTHKERRKELKPAVLSITVGPERFFYETFPLHSGVRRNAGRFTPSLCRPDHRDCPSLCRSRC